MPPWRKLFWRNMANNEVSESESDTAPAPDASATDSDGSGPAAVGVIVSQIQSLEGLLTSLAQASADSSLGLPSRPCLSEVALKLRDQLCQIRSKNDEAVLVEHDSIAISVANLVSRCQSAMSSLEDFDPDSKQDIVKHTLVLNHIQNELDFLFPEGYSRLVDEVTFKLASPAMFWKENFGMTHAVPWGIFLDAITREFGEQYITGSGGKELQEHVDMCEDGIVSTWEFDVFTQLFQPWGRLLNTWWVLTKKHPGYQAWMTFEEAQQILRSLVTKPGSYIFRLSVTKPGMWAVGYVSASCQIFQTIPSTKSLYQTLIDGALDGTYMYPVGQDTNIDPREHMEVDASSKVEVSAEDHAIYFRMDTVFEVCKICHSNPKNIKIEPCDHLLCSTCLDDWYASSEASRRRSGRQIGTCPFCRGPVENTVKIEIENKHAAVASSTQPISKSQSALAFQPSVDNRFVVSHQRSQSSRSSRSTRSKTHQSNVGQHSPLAGRRNTGFSRRRRESDDFVTINEIIEFRRQYSARSGRSGDESAGTIRSNSATSSPKPQRKSAPHISSPPSDTPIDDELQEAIRRSLLDMGNQNMSMTSQPRDPAASGPLPTPPPRNRQSNNTEQITHVDELSSRDEDRTGQSVASANAIIDEEKIDALSSSELASLLRLEKDRLKTANLRIQDLTEENLAHVHLSLTVRATVHDLEQKLKKAMEQIDKQHEEQKCLKDQVLDATIQCEKYQSEKDSLELLLHEASHQIEKLTAEKRTIENTLVQGTERIKKHRLEQGSLTTTNVALTTKLDQRTNEVVSLTQDLEQLKADLKERDDRISCITARALDMCPEVLDLECKGAGGIVIKLPSSDEMMSTSMV